MSTTGRKLFGRSLPRLVQPGLTRPLVARGEARTWLRWKGFVDRLLAVGLLLPGLPLMGFLVLLIRLTSRGPGIFRQVRLGRDSRPYTMFKLRSMRCDAEARTGPVWSTTNDPRVTRLGRFLRKSHLDELPQLFNVLRGEMSLIGPRPERPEIAGVLAEAIPGYTQRLAVLPGVTGLAQVNLPADTDLYSVRRKVLLDLQYIDEASLLLDLRILLSTLLRLGGCPGTLAVRITRVHRDAVLPTGVNGQHVDFGFLCPQDEPRSRAEHVHGSGEHAVGTGTTSHRRHPLAFDEQVPAAYGLAMAGRPHAATPTPADETGRRDWGRELK